MDKQELIDKAVEQFCGKWPATSSFNVYMSHRPEIEGTSYYPFYVTDYKSESYIYFHVAEFQQRASELGYINGYRWGVEYPTNGEKPDLPGDVLVIYQHKSGGDWLKNAFRVDQWAWEETGKAFKITDQRCKPADTGYLNAETIPVDSTEWYDYDNQKALRLPPVGSKCELWWGGSKIQYVEFLAQRGNTIVFWELVTDTADSAELPTAELRPLDWNRKAEQEREKAIKLAADKFHSGIMADYSGQQFLIGLGALYDAGFLRLPPQKD